MRLLPLALLMFLSTTASAQAPPALVEWQEKWTNSRDYTVEALELVPEDSLSFQPTPDQMTYHGQVRHMAGNIFGLSERYLDYRPAGYSNEAIRRRLQDETLTKQELKELLTEAYAFGSAAVTALTAARLEEQVDFFAGPKTRRQIAYLLQDHATHHRGQTLVYLRLLGLKPPRYRGW